MRKTGRACAAGKDTIPVCYLLSHQAGLPAIDEALPIGTLFDWDAMVHALEKQAPWWEPGTKHGYHAFTFGHLIGEVIRRITGKSLGTYFRDEIAGPLGADFHIGLAPEHDARTAEGIPADPPDPDVNTFLTDILSDPTSFRFKTLTNPPDLTQPGVANSIPWRRAEIPAANGHSNARGVARVYAALARGGELDGVRIMSPEAIERATVVQATGPDEVLHLDLHMALGWVVTSPHARMGPNARGFRTQWRGRLARLCGPGREARLRLRHEPPDHRRFPERPALARPHGRHVRLPLGHHSPRVSPAAAPMLRYNRRRGAPE